MKFFPQLMRVLASLGAPVAILVAGKLLELFSGAAPSDINPGVWVVLSGVAVFVLNFIIGKIPKPGA